MLSGQRPSQYARSCSHGGQSGVGHLFRYVHICQFGTGQTLRYENDKSSSKDLITIYRNQDKKHYHYSFELYFYSPNENWKKLKREKYLTEKSYFQK